MNKIFLAIFGNLLISNILIGCTCYQIESFDLQIYDQSEIIVEVEILNKIDDEYKKLVQQYKKDTLNWNKPYPPIPLIPPNDFSDFAVIVKKIYKGKLHSNQIILRANEKNSSCYWEPEVKESYILYLGNSVFDSKVEILQLFGACHRKINTSSSNYYTEKRTLNFFQSKPDGKFIINQIELISSNSNLSELITIEGEFQNGKRNGIWSLREPIIYYSDDMNSNETILKLSYEEGKLVNVEQFKCTNMHIKQYFLRWWFMNYTDKLVKP